MVGRWAGSPAGAEDQISEELTGGGVDAADVQVLVEEHDVGCPHMKNARTRIPWVRASAMS